MWPRSVPSSSEFRFVPSSVLSLYMFDCDGSYVVAIWENPETSGRAESDSGAAYWARPRSARPAAVCTDNTSSPKGLRKPIENGENTQNEGENEDQQEVHSRHAEARAAGQNDANLALRFIK